MAEGIGTGTNGKRHVNLMALGQDAGTVTLEDDAGHPAEYSVRRIPAMLVHRLANVPPAERVVALVEAAVASVRGAPPGLAERLTIQQADAIVQLANDGLQAAAGEAEGADPNALAGSAPASSPATK